MHLKGIFIMDVIESCFSRLPSEWWHLLSTTVPDHWDDIWKFLPFNHDFMMNALHEEGLIRKKRIDMSAFNLRFTGKFELTRFRPKGGSYMIFLRICGKGPPIQHKPQDQKEGTVVRKRDGSILSRPLMCRLRVGISMMGCIRQFYGVEDLDTAAEYDLSDASDINPPFTPSNTAPPPPSVEIFDSLITKYGISEDDERQVKYIENTYLSIYIIIIIFNHFLQFSMFILGVYYGN